LFEEALRPGRSGVVCRIRQEAQEHIGMEQDEMMERALKDHKNLIEKTSKKATEYDVTTTQAKVSEKDKPLITFALFAYNQERFIREAVDGAFSQTYEPLEIILSDDCSTDRTFEIMKEMVAAYTGAHNIVLNRNETNLGIRNHVNKVFSLAQGELLVLVAGDDISMPQRAEIISSTYIKSERKARLILSNYQIIDGAGALMEGDYIPDGPLTYDRFLKGYWHAYGAIMAIHKEIYDFFGPLIPGIHEDQILAHRALLLGPAEYIDEKLIKCRRHESNVTGGTIVNEDEILFKNHMIKTCLDGITCYASFLNDYIHWSNKNDNSDVILSNINIIIKNINITKILLKFYQSKLSRQLLHYLELIIMGVPVKLMTIRFKKVLGYKYRKFSLHKIINS
jgi:glycosyltransferase involved in cell wall biosynthesis